MLMVAGAISLLNVAVILLLIATPVTIGVVAEGTVAVTVGATPPLLPMLPEPRIESWPPPHPAAKAMSSNAINFVRNAEQRSNLFICLPSSCDPENHRLFDRPLSLGSACSAQLAARNFTH